MQKQTLDKLLSSNVISSLVYERVNIAKAYIEKKYSMKQKQEQQKNKDMKLINEQLNEINLSTDKKEMIRNEFLHKQYETMRQKRQKKTIYEYEPLSIIGRGGFGEVRVCRNKKTKEIVAIKKMKKSEMVIQNQLVHVRTEKEILTTNNEWIINLKCSFQDFDYLYLVMEYCQGGDLIY